MAKKTEVIDMGEKFNLKEDDRLEVQWELGGDGKKAKAVWWPAKLMKFGDEMHKLTDPSTSDEVAVPVRTLLYDAFPEEGFHEAETYKVAFLTDHLLYDLANKSTFHYRRSGDEWQPAASDMAELGEKNAENYLMNNQDCERLGLASDSTGGVMWDRKRESMMAILDHVLLQALETVKGKMGELTAEQSLAVAETIKVAKEKFLDELMNNSENETEITADMIRKCMEVVKKDLDELKAKTGSLIRPSPH